MLNFKIFLESEEEDNVKATIDKLPRSHRHMLSGYHFTFTPGNTLKGDNDHIGYIHQDKIVVAAPWHYSRSMVTLHEIAHLVYEKLMTPAIKKEWSDLLKSTKPEQVKENPASKDALNQNDEEIFCMVYAATYAKHPPTTYTRKEWQDFIKHRVPS